MTLAAAERHGVDVDVTAVDPFPTPLLERLASEGAITLLRVPAQTVAIETFTALEPGDLLLVDSTHTVKVGSEVNRLILEVLTCLKPGVVVHFHDITFPDDDQPDTLDGRLFFWDESTLLHAFLIGNAHARILLSQSMLVHANAQALDELLVGYRPARMQDGLFAGKREGAHFPLGDLLAHVLTGVEPVNSRRGRDLLPRSGRRFISSSTPKSVGERRHACGGPGWAEGWDRAAAQASARPR